MFQTHNVAPQKTWKNYLVTGLLFLIVVLGAPKPVQAAMCTRQSSQRAFSLAFKAAYKEFPKGSAAYFDRFNQQPLTRSFRHEALSVWTGQAEYDLGMKWPPHAFLRNYRTRNVRWIMRADKEDANSWEKGRRRYAPFIGLFGCMAGTFMLWKQQKAVSALGYQDGYYSIHAFEDTIDYLEKEEPKHLTKKGTKTLYETATQLLFQVHHKIVQ